MFLLLLLLSGPCGLHAGRHGPHENFLQMTVPEKVSSSNSKEHSENNDAYIITIEGIPYFVHLKKQVFLSPTSVVYSYDKDDIKHSTSLSVQTHCNYNGYVAGFPNSLVTLNTCSGLRGTIQLKNTSYGIEPMEAVSGFVHMIYIENNANFNVPVSGQNNTFAWLDDSQNEVRSSPQRTEFIKISPRYLAMHIVVDKNLFDYMGSDIKAVTQKVIQTIGLVNSMFTKLKLTVIISSIEIWSNKNKISTVGHPNAVLLRFLNWQHNHPERQHHHISYLFLFEKHPISIGATFPGKVCEKNYDAGVALYQEGISLESYSVIIVQLLGLSLGLTYDNSDTCYCSGDVCTMTPKAVHSGGVKEFSTCSLDDFKYFASHNGLECLQKYTSETQAQSPPKSVCGNGVLEGSEQCDCGTQQNCTHKACCDATLCKLKKNAQCGSGECCTKDCKIKKIDTLCRKKMDECDFTEYCDGKAGHCVPDTYARNGQSCDSGGAFCFQGICRSYDQQCRTVIKGAYRSGSFSCFEEMNARGDKFGNCGTGICDFDQVLCGKLVCAWPHKHLLMDANVSAVYAHVRDETCISIFKSSATRKTSDRGSTYKIETRDETYVQDGTVCGPEQFCQRVRCLEVRFHVNYTKCNSTRDCNGNGICNNFEHCHCNKGFYPPECKPRKGEFGSVDDGHLIKPGKSLTQGRYATFQKHQFQLIFYISIPVLIIITALLIKQRKIRELCYRGETESERSASEDISSSSKLSYRERL